MHTGQCIKRYMADRGISVTWLARKIYCTRANIYKIFSKESIDTNLLMRISHALRHDFFLDLSAALKDYSPETADDE